MKKLISLLLGACTVFAACTDDVENIRQDGSTKLAVNVKVNPTSRAMVHGTALPGGSSIGINVTDASGNPYDGKDAGYLNVQYTATGEAGAQTWAPATDAVLLSGTEGKMHAYYPWTTGIDYKAVAVDVADQIDWMYAADAYTVSDAKNAHEIVLSHAQTAINVNLVRDASYTGVGAVEALTVTSEGLASTASLDTRNGSFASVTGANTAISIIEAPYTLDGSTLSSKENPYMFIPASAETKDFTVSATLDGKSYSHKVTMAEAFAPGKVYKINVTFKNTGLEVSKVTLVDWAETGLGDAEFKPGQVEAQDPYADWVKLTYYVGDASQEQYIFFKGSRYEQFDISNVSAMMVQENELQQTNELVDVVPSKIYNFSTEGLHTVYVKFVDDYIPAYAFMETGITEVKIPNSIKNIGSMAFYYCTGLEKMSFSSNSTLEVIENKAFMGTGIKELIFPNSVKALLENSFWECSKLERIYIGSNMCYISSDAFLNCSNIESIVVDANNTVYDSRNNCNAIMEKSTNALIKGCKNTIIPQNCEIIGTVAFQDCNGLKSITIPESVNSIEDYAFRSCEDLTRIICLGTTLPTIERDCLDIGKEGGILIYPAGSDWPNWRMSDQVNTDGWKKVQEGEYFTENGVYYSTDGKEVIGYDETIPSQISLKPGVETIGQWAFWGCENLNSITFPESVTYIDMWAFEGCDGLTEITSLAMTAPDIHIWAFQEIKTNGTLYVPQGATGYDTWMQTDECYLGSFNWTVQEITE